MRTGDLVKPKRGHAVPGVVIEKTVHTDGQWIRVMWSDGNRSLERERDLAVLCYLYRFPEDHV